MPFGHLRPGRPGVEVERREAERRLRKVGDPVGDRQVADEAQPVKDRRQQGEAQQGDAGGGAVVTGPAHDQAEGEDHDDHAVGRQRRPLGTQREAQRDAGEHDRPAPSSHGGGVEMQVKEEIGKHGQRDRNDVDHRGARLDEGHTVEGCQHAGGDGKEPHRHQLPGEQVHQWDQRGAEERREKTPAERVEPEKLDTDRDDQLGERRFGVEVILAHQVLVRIVGEVELVEHERRVGRDVVRLAEPRNRWILIVVADAPGTDGRHGSGVGKDVEEDRAGEAQQAGDQGEGDQPVEVGAVQAPPAGACGSPDRRRWCRGDWPGLHQLAWPRRRPLICATKSSTPTIGMTMSAPATRRGPSCRSAASIRSDWRRSSRM